MLETNLKVINPLGLHARAAAQLVKLANSFNSEIRLTRTDNLVIADAKSILSVLTLAAGKGVELKLTVEGSDEKQAFEAIKEIFRKGFGEI
ncbi:MAG: HPr family phosphocarrier protein [Pyrinomonadaceae bacterium]|nr:HPr family phosphocarrier protein [Pyrinomonadaceae bacterium]MCX7639915.1 HPr family phosphocarrier protein [Pyrinomonadaceae bacterium]MDW8304087.1 HPr family phosphocarrier protein [Acidobacteriota bacterium]